MTGASGAGVDPAVVGRITLVYALSHFLVDFACAFLAWRYVKMARNGYHALLLYNFCAFALQMPLGLLLKGASKKRSSSSD